MTDSYSPNLWPEISYLVKIKGGGVKGWRERGHFFSEEQAIGRYDELRRTLDSTFEVKVLKRTFHPDSGVIEQILP